LTAIISDEMECCKNPFTLALWKVDRTKILDEHTGT
jgi:hypothetical protein